MDSRHVLTLIALTAGLVACDSGDINLSPTTVDNSTTNNPTDTLVVVENPCATYEISGQARQGDHQSNGNCVYDSSFVSDTRPITVDEIVFPALDDGGLHIFEDSLYIGEDVNAQAAATGKRIPQEGEGTRLIIEAGNTMVFQAADSYVRIARGSQIFAEGTAAEPIMFTADEDVILETATESDRGLWGGLQINGNGRTNKCHDGTSTGSGSGASDFEPKSNNVHNCHVTAEGRPATYGGNNNSENSGVLRYVVIKHAGFEVVDGDELNALTLNAVGSGTTIQYVQTYTSQDDGFEMFGGAVNMDHIVAVNVGDDSIDYSEGYNGDIQYAVVVHTSGGNRCIEGDNTGGNRDGFDVRAWLAGTVGADNRNRNNLVVDNLPMVMLLDGGVGSRGYRTLDSIQDSTGAAVSVLTTPVGDILGGIFRNPTYLGGASTDDDWLAGWAVGLDAQLNP